MAKDPPKIEGEVRRDSKKANFAIWKAGVGLPHSFPNLAPIADEDLAFDRTFYASQAHLKAITEIKGRAGGTLTRVWLSPGQGCTTLSRFIFRVLSEDAIQRRMIPVRIAFDDIFRRHLLEKPLDLIQEAMRRDIVWSLAHERWDYVLGDQDYARVIGATTYDPMTWNELRLKLNAIVQERDEKCRRSARDSGTIVDYPIRRDEPIPEERLDRAEEGFFDLEALRKVSNILAEPIDDVLATLSTTFRVRVCLQVDLSSPLAYSKNPDERKLYDEMVAALQRGIKALHQRDQEKHPPTYPAVLNEMYFGHEQAFQTLEYGWHRGWVDVYYPWYRQFDFMAILSRYHYQQLAAQNKQEALAAVMHQNLLDGCVAEELTISETIARLTSRCCQVLADSDKIPYQLYLDDGGFKDRGFKDEVEA